MKKTIPVLKVLLLEYVVSVVLLLLVAFCMYKAGLTQNMAKVMVLGVYFIANFIGGLVMGKAQKNKRLIWGLLMGTVYFVILVFASMLMDDNATEKNSLIIVALSCILGGCMGGMFS